MAQENDTKDESRNTSAGGTERFNQIVSVREKVAFDRENGIVHDPDTECGSGRPTLDPETLGEDERWLCRRCFGYPGTTSDLDAVLREKAGGELPDGTGTLAGWTA